MLTVAIRGPLAEKMRELAESTRLSLAKLLGDMMLVYEGEVDTGYKPGTSLANWRGQQGEHAGDACPERTLRRCAQCRLALCPMNALD